MRSYYLTLTMIVLAIIKYFLLFLSVSFTFVMLVELIGRLLESELQVSLSNSYFVPSNQVFQKISNPSAYPQWRNQVEEIHDFESNKNSWVERLGSINLKMSGTIDSNGEQQFIAKAIDSKGFTYERKYIVYRQDKMTFLKVADHFHFSSAFLRLFTHLFYDHSNFLKQELRNLDRIFS